MSNKTLQHAALGGFAFFAVSLPDLYARSNKFLAVDGNCPSWKSRLLHTIAFFVVTHLITTYVENPEDKSTIMKKCMSSTLLFFILSSPEVYRLTNSFGFINTADDNTACPTMTGILVHSGVFFVANLLIQQFNLV
jgi:hypothetical protein